MPIRVIKPTVKSVSPEWRAASSSRPDAFGDTKEYCPQETQAMAGKLVDDATWAQIDLLARKNSQLFQEPLAINTRDTAIHWPTRRPPISWPNTTALLT
jgi:hypothetical protein